ncbi:hypothetical protein P3X46_017867 [Hevea brasiliensis]|uniref:Uncharacterized protein n=1 Tax=Hevea brasiliensis TaxID=3981 RepID=A0ABQ9LNZ9_HEVBR|nr:uncharacterized protein LOC110641732 isoform X1 [Hevea brasiliensis]KAJ9169706.1 hypothetical protein P3X46_017867 [Hevea brasiliensis]
MKRKSSQINTEHPSPIRSSFPRGFYGVQASKTRFKYAECRTTKGIGCKERVRFTDLVNDDELQESASVPLQRNYAPRSDDPKTSEYAFFKKLKSDANHRFHSHALHQDENQSLNLKPSDYSRERTNIIENSYNDFKSPVLPKNVTPENFVSFLSPLSNASKKSGLDMKRVGTTMVDIHRTLENKEYGAQCKNADVFFRKRQKLRQLVANTSFSEVDELCSKGCDFVSVLLSKLFPESNKGKSFEDVKTGKLEIDTNCKPLASPETDVDFKISNWMTRRNFMELEFEPSLDVGFSSCWLGMPRERDVPNFRSQSCHSHRTYLDNVIMEVDYELGERAAPILCIEGDSAFDFHVRKHRSFTSRHLKGLDEFHCPIEPLLGRQRHTFLLGYDYDNMIDKSKLSMPCQDTELALHPDLSSSYGDQQQGLDNSFTVGGLNSLFSYCPPNLPSLQFSPSAGIRSHNFGKCFPEVKDDIVAVINKFSLSLSHPANHLNLDECSPCDTTCKGGILLSPENHLWFVRKVLNEEHHCSGTEALFSTGPDFYLEPMHIPVSCSLRDHYKYTWHAHKFHQNEGMPSHFLIGDKNVNYLDGLSHRGLMNHEDMIDIPDWSSFYFQMSVNKEKICPLLLSGSE